MRFSVESLCGVDSNVTLISVDVPITVGSASTDVRFLSFLA